MKKPADREEGNDKLVDEIISNSLDMNDWIKQIQPEQGHKPVRDLSRADKSAKTTPTWITALMQFVRKILGRVRRRKFIEITQVVQFGYVANDCFWGGWCDSPQADSTYQGKMLSVWGWVIGKSARAVSVRLMVNQTLI